jgi:Domain of unknown function (DUF4333)
MSPSKSALRPLALWRNAVAAVSMLTVAVGASACGSSSPKHPAAPKATATPAPTSTVKLDTARVALAITQSIKSEKGLKATVLCPSDVPQLKGHTFTCVATTYAREHGNRVPVHTNFTVSQTNNKGDVYYASPG